MESISFRQLQVVEDQLRQIRDAILQLKEWNKSLNSIDDLLTSPDGMKTLAADCMLIEAIGEGFKKVDTRTQHQLLPARPEIPWKQVMGMRNHIAHGYFDINADLVWDVIQNDLDPLLEAIDYFQNNIYKIIPFEENR